MYNLFALSPYLVFFSLALNRKELVKLTQNCNSCVSLWPLHYISLALFPITMFLVNASLNVFHMNYMRLVASQREVCFVNVGKCWNCVQERHFSRRRYGSLYAACSTQALHSINCYVGHIVTKCLSSLKEIPKGVATLVKLN